MKIFNDHEKMEKHFEAVERMKKRYVFIFAFIAVVLILISIYFFVTNSNMYGIFTIIVAVVMFMASFRFAYVQNKMPEKLPAYNDVLNDYCNKTIKRELANRGLKLDYIDSIVDPNGGVKVAYYYDKNTYYIGYISLGYYGFGVEANKSMELIDVKIYNKYFPKKSYGKLSSLKTKGLTREGFYDSFVEYINNNANAIEELSYKCREALKENSELYK